MMTALGAAYTLRRGGTLRLNVTIALPLNKRKERKNKSLTIVLQLIRD